MFHNLIVTLSIGLCISTAHEQPRFDQFRNVSWTGGNTINWPNSVAKAIYKSFGGFESRNILATRVAIYEDSAIVTIPRFRPGIPFSLGKIDLKIQNNESSISPYPHFIHEEGNCAALQNAVDIFLDSYDIIWVLDTGIVDTLVQPIRQCPPKVIAIDVRTQQIVKSIDLTKLTNSQSRPQYVTADYTHDGRIFIYVSDASNLAILVYDITNNIGFRVILPKVIVESKPDVLYTALIHRSNNTSSLIFSYYSGTRMFGIETKFLQSGNVKEKIDIIGRINKDVILLGADGSSSIFVRNEGSSNVYKIDMLYPLTIENVQLVYEGNSSMLPTHVVKDYEKDKMCVLESNFLDYFEGTVDDGVKHSLNII